MIYTSIFQPVTSSLRPQTGCTSPPALASWLTPRRGSAINKLIKKKKSLWNEMVNQGWLKCMVRMNWPNYNLICFITDFYRCFPSECNAQLFINGSVVVQLFSCVRLCNLMDTPGFPVFHHLLEFVKTHVHWVSDAIQTSHPLSRREVVGGIWRLGLTYTLFILCIR